MTHTLESRTSEQRKPKNSVLAALGRLAKNFFHAPGATEMHNDVGQSGAERITIAELREGFNGYLRHLPYSPQRGQKASRLGNERDEHGDTLSRIAVQYDEDGKPTTMQQIVRRAGSGLFDTVTYWDDPVEGPYMRAVECREVEGLDPQTGARVTRYDETEAGQNRAVQRPMTLEDITRLPDVDSMTWGHGNVVWNEDHL